MPWCGIGSETSSSTVPTKLPRTTERLLSAPPSTAEPQMLEKQPSATTTSSASFLPFLAFPARAHPNHAPRERAFDQICRGCFDNVDAGGRLGVCTELLHEAAVVEGAASGAGGVWYKHGFSGIKDCIAVHGTGSMSSRHEPRPSERRKATPPC